MRKGHGLQLVTALCILNAFLSADISFVQIFCAVAFEGWLKKTHGGKCMTLSGWSFEKESGNYEPLPSKYLQIKRRPEFDERVVKLSAYLPEAQRRFFLEKAYPFTYFLHNEQYRKSGEPYITHPIAVAEILAKYHVDCDTLCAGLMHDTYEDNPDKISLDEIALYFGPEICSLIDGMTKIGIASSQNRRQTAVLRKELSESGYNTIANQKVYKSMMGQKNGAAEDFTPNLDKEARAKRIKIANQNASLAKLLLGIAEDPRIILIKLADRLNNIRTLGSLRRDKQKRIARETLEFFCPIADRFGVWDIKQELEELCFSFLYDNIYDIFKNKVEKVRQDRRPIIESAADQIKEVLQRENIKADVQISDSGLYPVYKRMESSGITSVDEVGGLSSIAITVLDKDACINAEAAIRKNSHTCGNLFYRDYIANPKPNKYKAIHLAINNHEDINNREKYIIKIRINSVFDNVVNNIGIFSEFSNFDYAIEGSNIGQALCNKWASWISSIRALHDVAQENTDFLDWVLSGSLASSITCFTPRGDAINLPIGSTPLDFAFAIHTELGLTCDGALVNERSVSYLEYELKDNDFVSIISSKNVIPQRSWFDYCCTPKAKLALTNWYKEHFSVDSNQSYGKKLLIASLLKANLPGLQKNEKFMRLLARKCNCRSVPELLSLIGTRRISLKFVGQQFEECKFGCGIEKKIIPSLGFGDISIWVHVPALSGFKGSFCPECCPVIGDEVFVLGPDSAQLTLHRQGCRAAIELAQTSTASDSKVSASAIRERAFWLEGTQIDNTEAVLRARLEIKAVYNFALAVEVMVRCRDLERKIYNLNLENNFEGNAAYVNITVGVNNLSELNSLMKNLRKIDGVAEVQRL